MSCNTGYSSAVPFTDLFRRQLSLISPGLLPFPTGGPAAQRQPLGGNPRLRDTNGIGLFQGVKRRSA